MTRSSVGPGRRGPKLSEKKFSVKAAARRLKAFWRHPILPPPQVTSHTVVSPSLPPETVIIRPKSGWQSFNFREVWLFRELLLTLAARDIRVRYKQTILGAAWAVIQPVAQMLVFTTFFAAHGFSTEGVPAPVFYFSGLLAWQLFATSLSAASNSLVANRSLITKVYFPRLVVPLASIASSLVDFGISFIVLLVIMALSHVMPSANIVALPVFVLACVGASFAFALWLSALNVEFRDVQYVIPFMVQFWLFVTPVIYPSSSVSGTKRLLLALNPMSAVVEGFRWCLLGRPRPGSELVISLVVLMSLLVGGLFFFRRMEKTFADQL
jgi:lipopolysaccharide transport system permease protein